MAKTVRWAVETNEIVLRALELRAQREGGSLSEVVEAVLRQALTAEIDEVSGAVPLAAMIQTVVRRQARAAGRSTPAGRADPVLGSRTWA